MQAVIILAISLALASAAPVAPKADYESALVNIQKIKFIVATSQMQVNIFAFEDNIRVGVTIAKKLLVASIEVDKVLNKMIAEMFLQTLTPEAAQVHLEGLHSHFQATRQSLQAEFALLSDEAEANINTELDATEQEVHIISKEILQFLKI